MTEPAGPARPVPRDRGDLPAPLWSAEVVIRFGQCDPAGIVYTPNFFDIFNVVVEEWYARALGLDYYELIGSRRVGLGYASAHADFFVPCRMGETLAVVPAVGRVGASSFSLVLHAFKGDREAVRGGLTVVTTDLATHKPIRLPDDLRAALLRSAAGPAASPP